MIIRSRMSLAFHVELQKPKTRLKIVTMYRMLKAIMARRKIATKII
jgi:hypothetical protein